MEEEPILPPGYRFYPTEEELVSFYLTQKLEGRRQDLDHVIPLVQVYDFSPWDLPQFGGVLCREDVDQWFFYNNPRIGREAAQGGSRVSRLTDLGYWKASGTPGFVYSSVNNRIIGVKKTMAFYIGRSPSGKKTQWKMNEYHAIEASDHEACLSTSTPKLREELSLCRVYKSKGLREFDRRPLGDAKVEDGAQHGYDKYCVSLDDQSQLPLFSPTPPLDRICFPMDIPCDDHNMEIGGDDTLWNW